MKNKKTIIIIIILGVFGYTLFTGDTEKSKIERNVSVLNDKIHSVKSKSFSWVKRTAYFNTPMSNVTKEQIESYLHKKLDSLTLIEPGVLIWLYPSREHAIERGVKWIAMIDCQAYKTPKFTFDEKRFNEFTYPVNDTINNVPKKLRQEIWRAINFTEEFARVKAEMEFKDPNDWEKKHDEEDKISRKLKKSLLEQYNIDEDIYANIMAEGINKGWLEKGNMTFIIKAE